MKEKYVMTGMPMKPWGSKEVINWNQLEFFHANRIYSYGIYVQVLSTEMVERISKSGNKRRERRLNVTIDGVNVINTSAASIKTGGFLRKCEKMMDEKQLEGWMIFHEHQENLNTDKKYRIINKKLIQEEIEDMTRCYDMVIEAFAKMESELEFFVNLDDNGNIIFQTPEEYIENMDKRLTITDDDPSYISIIFANEWRTHYRQIFLDFMRTHWQEIMEQTERFFKKYFLNESNTNEYDELFQNCRSVKEIKKIYRQWSKQLHPDHGGDAEEFKALNAAYERALTITAFDTVKSDTEPNEPTELDDLEREFMIHVMGEALYGEMLIEQGVKCITQKSFAA